MLVPQCNVGMCREAKYHLYRRRTDDQETRSRLRSIQYGRCGSVEAGNHCGPISNSLRLIFQMIAAVETADRWVPSAAKE